MNLVGSGTRMLIRRADPLGKAWKHFSQFIRFKYMQPSSFVSRLKGEEARFRRRLDFKLLPAAFQVEAHPEFITQNLAQIEAG
jgi:hypothetical protein